MYTLLDVVHPPEGYALRCALGYALVDEAHQTEGDELQCTLWGYITGYTYM